MIVTTLVATVTVGTLVKVPEPSEPALTTIPVIAPATVPAALFHPTLTKPDSLFTTAPLLASVVKYIIAEPPVAVVVVTVAMG